MSVAVQAKTITKLCSPLMHFSNWKRMELQYHKQLDYWFVSHTLIVPERKRASQNSQTHQDGILPDWIYGICLTRTLRTFILCLVSCAAVGRQRRQQQGLILMSTLFEGPIRSNSSFSPPYQSMVKLRKWTDATAKYIR